MYQNGLFAHTHAPCSGTHDQIGHLASCTNTFIFKIARTINFMCSNNACIIKCKLKNNLDLLQQQYVAENRSIVNLMWMELNLHCI